MNTLNVPDGEMVVAILRHLGGKSTCEQLCNGICDHFSFSKKAAQLGIQRAIERGDISLAIDWTVYVKGEFQYPYDRIWHPFIYNQCHVKCRLCLNGHIWYRWDVKQSKGYNWTCDECTVNFNPRQLELFNERS